MDAKEREKENKFGSLSIRKESIIVSSSQNSEKSTEL